MIKGNSGSFYLSQKNTNFDLSGINELSQYINKNLDKPYAYTSDDLNFIPFIYDKAPSQYNLDIGQMNDYNQRQFINSFWQDYFNFSKKNIKVFYVLTSKSSIRDKNNHDILNKYLLPYFQRNNFHEIKKINNLSIFLVKN